MIFPKSDIIDDTKNVMDDNMRDTFQNRLIEAMEDNNIKAADLARKTGLSKAQISQYTNGIYEAKQLALYKIAVALNVSEAWLMGYDVPKSRTLISKDAEITTMYDQIQLYFGSDTVQMVKCFTSLNNSGRKRLLGFAEDLLKIEEYKHTNNPAGEELKRDFIADCDLKWINKNEANISYSWEAE